LELLPLAGKILTASVGLIIYTGKQAFKLQASEISLD
jgi:hypothetical protein